ncbi:DUF7266 family protein [Haloarchaeobius sp. HRN-SO-5]|uniref:DUF7266 family protein n=1 Tax=Haloarchaeobius sp. HRN-SO-5 TaxID=3446118 RepID=UPI003EBE5C3A
MIRVPTHDDRGVSIAITHVLTIGITTILVAGLLVGTSGLLQDEKSNAARDELRTIGNRIVSDLSHVDHTTDGSTGEMTLETEHPAQVSGSGYAVRLYEPGSSECAPYDTAPYNDDGKTACLVLESSEARANIVVPFRNDTAVTESSVSGGDLYIVYDGSSIRLSSDRPSPRLGHPSTVGRQALVEGRQ